MSFRVLSGWQVVGLLLTLLPLCHLTVTLGFSLPGRLRCYSEIYPLLDFEPSLECDPKTTIPVLICRVHTTELPESPLLEFPSLKHIQPEDYVGTGNA